MFSAFLSRDMTYSCGVFPDLDADLNVQRGELGAVNGGFGLISIKAGEEADGRTAETNGDVKDELEEAQMRKIG